MWIWIWLAVTCLALIIEFATLEMVSIWFSIGGLVALILAACNLSYAVQLIAFVAVSLVMLLSFRGVTLKYLVKEKSGTNIIDSVIGQKHKLLSEISFDAPGSLVINGITWTAIDEEKNEIPAGELVEVLRIEGNKLIVKKVKEWETEASPAHLEEPVTSKEEEAVKPFTSSKEEETVAENAKNNEEDTNTAKIETDEAVEKPIKKTTKTTKPKTAKTQPKTAKTTKTPKVSKGDKK